jgi:DNA topoisomerase-1
VRRRQALPGQDLFQYLDAQRGPHPVGSADVNAYLRDAGGKFTAKDFRTWHAVVPALRYWRDLDPAEAAEPAPALAKRVLTAVADRLGNAWRCAARPTSYPRVLALFALDRRRDGAARTRVAGRAAEAALRLDGAERDLLALLGRSG